MTAPARKTLKPADDQPFDFNLDAVQAEVDLTPWRVHFGGQRWTFKHPQEIDMWEVMDWDESPEASESTAMIGVFKAALGDEQFEIFRKIRPFPMYKVKALFDAYQAYGGMEPGEAKGSDD